MLKNKLKLKTRNLCLALQICCLVIGGGLDMAVLCHADDGHVAIEPANAQGCTNSSANRHADNHQTGFSAEDDCGDCIDVPLTVGRATAEKKPVRAKAAPLIGDVTLSQAVPDATAHKLLTQLVLPPPYLGPLSSIVLLI